MKKLLFCALTAILLTSCSTDYISPLKNLAINELIFETGDNYTTIKLGDEDMSKFNAISTETWCSVTIKEKSININLTPNDTYYERYASVIITDMIDGTEAVIKVRQLVNKVSVNFSFDDGYSQDSDIKTVFDEFNVKCGFAIINANQRYIDYANEGFEILAHNSEPLDNANEDQIRKSMIDGKKVVESLGLVCHGWVTPSSSLPEIHQHIVKDYFEYGYTVYKGNQATGQTETNDLQSYQLWRVHMNVLKDNYKRIFADMIQEKGMVSVYAHGVELNNPDNWTLNDLRTILQYCKSNDIDVLTPYDSCRRLFSE